MALEGFTQSFVSTNGIRLSVHRAGQGMPLVLLHGYPQTHLAWEKVAPRLAETFDVIVPDLRGYGDSDCPTPDATYRAYSKREMARDIAGLLDALGLDRVHVLGHDRGARVAYRFALDHADRTRRLGIVEVVPTGDFWGAWSAELAMKAYHWTFLAQPAPLPERMILADGPAYLDWTLASWTRSGDLSPFSDAALAAYRAQMADPARVAAMCADYRAGASVDREMDSADRADGRRIAAPVHFVWGADGFPARTGAPLAIWERWADTVSGGVIDGVGHFAMDEAPEALLAAFLPFFETP